MRVIILIVVFCCSCGAQSRQDWQHIRVSNLQGLNTTSDPFDATPGQAEVLNNVDLQRSIGDWSKRYGYDSVGVFPSGVGSYPTVDSILGIYFASYRDRSFQLFVVVAIQDSGYGAVYVTKERSLDLSDCELVVNYFCITAYPEFCQYDDMVIINSPASDGVVYNRGIHSRFPVKTPGTPRALPLNIDGPLYGEYYYALQAHIDDSVAPTGYDGPRGYSRRLGPIYADSQKVLIYDFPYPTEDSQLSPITCAHYLLWRTNGDIKSWVLESRDSISQFKVFESAYVDNDTDAEDGNAYYGSLVYFDSASDSTCTHPYTPYRGMGTPYWKYMWGDASGASIYDTWPQDDTAGYIYRYTYLDKSTGLESNIGNAFDMPSSASEYDSVEFYFAPTPTDNTLIKLYRAPRMYVEHDTVIINYIEGSSSATIDSDNLIVWLCNGEYIATNSWDATTQDLAGDLNCTRVTFERAVDDRVLYKPAVYPGAELIRTRWTTLDSIYTLDYKLIATIDGDSATCVTHKDKLNFTNSFSSEQLYPTYQGTTIPASLSSMMTFERRVWAAQGSNLYWSEINNATVWGGARVSPINHNDGDRIMALVGARGLLQVWKRYSAHNVYTGLDQETYSDWQKVEISSHIGCLSPRGHATSSLGDYFITDIGVLLQTEGAYRERTFARSMIDANITNLRDLPQEVKSSLYTLWWDQHILFCANFPGATVDTTYVWDEIANGWTTWTGLPIRSATRVIKDNLTTFSVTDTLYVVLGTDLNIYSLGSSETDNGSNIPMSIRMRPLAASTEYKDLRRLGLWIDAGTTDDTAFVSCYNEWDSLAVADTADFPLSVRYREIEPAPHGSLYFKPDILTGGTLVDTTVDHTVIEAIDLWYTPVEEVAPSQ